MQKYMHKNFDYQNKDKNILYYVKILSKKHKSRIQKYTGLKYKV